MKKMLPFFCGLFMAALVQGQIIHIPADYSKIPKEVNKLNSFGFQNGNPMDRLFSKLPINNARLLLYKTYEQDLSDFEELFAISGNSFEKFLEHCRELEKHPQPEIGLKDLIKKLKSGLQPISQ